MDPSPNPSSARDELVRLGLDQLPYHVCVRGPGGAVGYETLLVDASSGEPDAVVVAFSTREQAAALLQAHAADDAGWQIGMLTSWPQVLAMLGAYPSARYVCLDPPLPPATGARLHALDHVLPLMRSLVATDA